MAAPTYTTDLITVTDASTGFTEPAGDLQGTLAAGETDFFIQGTNCTSKSIGTVSSPPKLAGAGYQAATALTIPTNGAVMVWIYFACPNAISLEASGGLQCISGQDVNNYKRHYVRGSDTYTYGGWLCIPFDPANATDGTAYGTPSATVQYLGWSASVMATISKGNPYGVDAIRYGRCELAFTGGDSGSYATFAGAVTQNDNITNRWGLLQDVGGSYLQQGLILFGKSTQTTTFRARNASNVATLTTSAAHLLNVGDTVVITGVGGSGYNATAVVTVVGSTTTFSYANTGGSEGTTADTGGYINAVCDFRDSNRVLTIANTKKVPSAFNAYEVRNVSSRIDLTGVSIVTLGTISRGNWSTTDDADINITGCTFTDMGTFGFLAQSTILTTIFRRTDVITTGGATFTVCTFDNNRASKAVLAASTTEASLISNSTFISDGTGYGMEISGSAANMTLTGNTFTGYQAYQEGGTTTGNEALYVNIVTGSMTITISGGSTPSYRTSGAAVTISSGYTLTLTGLVNGSDIVILAAGTSTERVNVNENSGTTYGHGYTDSGTSVDIGIFKIGYVPFYIRSYTLAASNASLPINQILDRNYLE